MIPNIPPSSDILDLQGGILGKREDCTLEGRLPLDEDFREAFDFLERLGKSQGYIPLEKNAKDDAKTYIRENAEHYCKTYIN